MRLIESFTAVLENGAQNRWNAREVESALAELGWPEEMQAAFVRAWRKDEGDLHAAVVRASSWTSTLSEAPAWRIDVKTKARYAGDLNEPTAIVQLAVQDAEGDGSRDVQFEMSREQVVSTLDELNKIEALIKRATQA